MRGAGGDEGEEWGAAAGVTMWLRRAGAATVNAEAAARVTEAVCASAGVKEGGGEGDDGDGNGGGEAARGRTITEQAASVLWRLRARRATMGSGDGGEAWISLCRK